MQIFTDGTVKPSSLICQESSGMPVCTFTDSPSGSVFVEVGDIKTLISREELAAASQLFPPRRRH